MKNKCVLVLVLVVLVAVVVVGGRGGWVGSETISKSVVKWVASVCNITLTTRSNTCTVVGRYTLSVRARWQRCRPGGDARGGGMVTWPEEPGGDVRGGGMVTWPEEPGGDVRGGGMPAVVGVWMPGERKPDG
jgi:hypothetical protein